jgi:hypothetical protein
VNYKRSVRVALIIIENIIGEHNSLVHHYEIVFVSFSFVVLELPGIQNKSSYLEIPDRFCGLVVRDPGYRSRGPGSISGDTRYSEK